MMTGPRLTAATGETPQPKESTDNLGFHKPVESGGPSGSGVAERKLQRFNGWRFIKKVMRRRRGGGLDIRFPGCRGLFMVAAQYVKRTFKIIG